MELGFLIVGRRRITALKAAENAVKNTGHNDAIYTAYKSNSDFETAVSEVASAFHRTKYSGYGKMAEKVVGGLKKRGFLK